MSCNYYADLGYADPIGMYRKSRIALAIEQTLDARKMSLAEAAKVTGISRARLQRILDGEFRHETVDLLTASLRKLGHEIVINPPTLEPEAPGEFHLIPPLLIA